MADAHDVLQKRWFLSMIWRGRDFISVVVVCLFPFLFFCCFALSSLALAWGVALNCIARRKSRSVSQSCFGFCHWRLVSRCCAHQTSFLSSHPHIKKQDVHRGVTWCNIRSHVCFPLAMCVGSFLCVWVRQNRLWLHFSHLSLLRHRTMAQKVSPIPKVVTCTTFKINFLFLLGVWVMLRGWSPLAGPTQDRIRSDFLRFTGENHANLLCGIVGAVVQPCVGFH